MSATTKGPTIIELGDEDAALVIRDNMGEFEMVIPSNQAEVSDSTRWVCAIGMRWESDPEWREELKSWFNNVMKQQH